jgi:arylsulfatase A-like enzyme
MSIDLPLPRRRFLQTSAAAAVGAAAVPWSLGQAPAARRHRAPNILFISTDQWHAEAFSHFGNPWVRTPHSDRIFERGLSFDRAYCADPVCAPSRTSWITGRMPAEHRVIGNGINILESMVDLGQWFGQHGYETAHFGKWHTSGRDPGKSHDFNHGMHPAGQYGDYSVAQMASSYLLGRSARKPFMMHVAFMNPHDICQTSCLHTGRGVLPVDRAQLPPLPANFRARPDEPGTLVARVRNSKSRVQQRTWTDDDWRAYIWSYYRYCELVDAAIGRVLDALDASGQRDNTLLVYSSDHGEGLGHHGLYTKAFLYEEASRVPFVIDYPDHVPPGQRNDNLLVSGVDLLPTFCAAAGIPAPPQMCGHDVLAQVERNQNAREALVTSASFGGHMVRDDRYKLIRYRDDPTVQLFDLVDDPGETRNLAGTSPRKVNELWAQAEAFHDTLTPFEMPPGGVSELFRMSREARQRARQRP